MGNNSNPRYIAAKLLDKTFSEGSYSNIRLNSGLERSELDSQGKRLCTAIYYGVIQRKITLDYVLAQYCSRPLKKMDSIIVTILRCGIYQLLYMDSIPDNAAVNESVELSKKFGKASASGMVNGVLRSFIRGGKKINCKLNGVEKLSVEYSAPVEFIESLTADYGEEKAEEFLEASLADGVIYIRRNPLKCSHEQLLSALSEYDVKSCGDFCYFLENGDVVATEAFKSGFFHVQDAKSQMCCMALSPTENDMVLDICAAPGGKTFTMAEMMNGRGEIHAFDIHDKRVSLIRQGAERLGLRNITARTGDASKYDPELPKYTKILCDVPCSGFGVIMHKAEIKYKSLSDFDRLPEIQYNIAENALNYLAVGGEMVYSTCTVRKAENDAVVERLLKNHPELRLAEMPEIFGDIPGNPITFFPFEGLGCDGFFVAKFKKIR